jgi:hypothetical protein
MDGARLGFGIRAPASAAPCRRWQVRLLDDIGIDRRSDRREAAKGFWRD